MHQLSKLKLLSKFTAAIEILLDPSIDLSLLGADRKEKEACLYVLRHL